MSVNAINTRPRTSALRMPSTPPAIRNANHRYKYLTQLSLNGHWVVEGQTIQIQFNMKQSGHLAPSEETRTLFIVTSKYGRTPPNKHVVVVVRLSVHVYFNMDLSPRDS